MLITRRRKRKGKIKMIDGIRFAVSSYNDEKESAELAVQIAFFLAKERKNKVYFIENKENSLIDKMRGRTELNDVTFYNKEPEPDLEFKDDDVTRLYVYDLGLTTGPIPMSDKFKKIYVSIDNEKTNVSQVGGRLASITDGEQLVTVLLQHADKDALQSYREIAKSVIQIQEPDYSRCPFYVKQDLDNFSHKSFFSVPDPKKIYNFEKLPIKEEPVSNKKEKKPLFAKKKQSKEDKKENKKQEDVETVSQTPVPSIPDYEENETDKEENTIHAVQDDPKAAVEAENEYITSDERVEPVSVDIHEYGKPKELKPSIYGEDDDEDDEPSGLKDKFKTLAGNLKEKSQNNSVKKKKKEKPVQREFFEEDEPSSKEYKQKSPIGHRRILREPDYAEKIQSLRDKSQFINTAISFVNICLAVAILVTGYNFFMGFRDKCHAPVQTGDIIITKEPTTNGISGIEIKNYSGVAKNKKMAVIIGEDTFIRPYTEDLKDLQKKTSVKTKRYAVTVSFTDEPMLQSMFGELTFVHYSTLGESKFSNEDYDEIIKYAKRYYTKKKYDFFKYKDKDSIQLGEAPVSMIQKLESN